MKPSLRLLMIEDSPDDASLIVIALSKQHKLVWKRVETESALIVALYDEWDVVLCDYSLPKMSIEKAVHTIRTHPVNEDIPVIIISGVIDDEMAIGLLKIGINDFVEKKNINRLSLAIRREIAYARERKDILMKNDMIMQESYDNTIAAWGKALELRDHFTNGHTQRVTDLSLRLALELDITNDNFIALNRGALLHDIGKMGIPDIILLKEDTLLPEEEAIMRQHPVLAKQMIEGIPFLKSCIEVPYCHHERWDGSGYPNGLKGEEIPFLARLFSVVDVYDALTSDRPYRRSWSKEKAIQHLVDEKGKLFDPRIVDAFVTMIGRR